MNDKDLTQAFGELRSLINQTYPALSEQVWSYSVNLPEGRPRLLQLMIDVQREAPAHYKAQWLPYLQGFELPQLFISAQKDLKSLSKVLPDRGQVSYTLLTNKFELSHKSATSFSRLKALRLVDSLEVLCRLEAGSVDILCASPHLVHLRHLLITSLHLSPPQIAPVLNALHTTSLQKLDLGNSEMGVEGARTIAAHQALKGLTSLRLTSNDLESASLAALATSPTMSNLHTLELSYNDIADEGIEALAHSPHLSKLERLTLNCNQVTDQGALAILNSATLPNLRILDLRNNNLSEEMTAALSKRFSTH